MDDIESESKLPLKFCEALARIMDVNNNIEITIDDLVNLLRILKFGNLEAKVSLIMKVKIILIEFLRVSLTTLFLFTLIVYG
jgi:hypothetical protein